MVSLSGVTQAFVREFLHAHEISGESRALMLVLNDSLRQPEPQRALTHSLEVGSPAFPFTPLRSESPASFLSLNEAGSSDSGSSSMASSPLSQTQEGLLDGEGLLRSESSALAVTEVSLLFGERSHGLVHKARRQAENAYAQLSDDTSSECSVAALNENYAMLTHESDSSSDDERDLNEPNSEEARFFEYFKRLKNAGKIRCHFENLMLSQNSGDATVYYCLIPEAVDLRYIMENYLPRRGPFSFPSERFSDFHKTFGKSAVGVNHARLFVGSFEGGRVSPHALRRYPLISYFSGFLKQRYKYEKSVLTAFEEALTGAVLCFQSDSFTNALSIKRSIFKKFIELCLDHPGLKEAYKHFWQEQGVNMFNQTADAQKPLAELADEYRRMFSPAACN